MDRAAEHVPEQQHEDHRLHEQVDDVRRPAQDLAQLADGHHAAVGDGLAEGEPAAFGHGGGGGGHAASLAGRRSLGGVSGEGRGRRRRGWAAGARPRASARAGRPAAALPRPTQRGRRRPPGTSRRRRLDARLLARGEVGQRGGRRIDVARASARRTLSTLPPISALSSAAVPCGGDAAAVDDGDLLREAVGLIQVLRGEQDRGPVAAQLVDERARAPGANAGRAPSWARRAGSPAGRRSARPPGRAGGACRPNTSTRAAIGRLDQREAFEQLARAFRRGPAAAGGAAARSSRGSRDR